jgi:hypothetical protein
MSIPPGTLLQCSGSSVYATCAKRAGKRRAHRLVCLLVRTAGSKGLPYVTQCGDSHGMQNTK